MKTIEYRVLYTAQVKEYINGVPDKQQAKIYARIEFLKENKGYLDEPYSKYINGKIRELIINFSNSHHRIFYCICADKKIILVHAFLKKTPKTPPLEIKKAQDEYNKLK